MAGSWSDYWSSLSDAQNYYNSPDSGGSGAAPTAVAPPSGSQGSLLSGGSGGGGNGSGGGNTSAETAYNAPPAPTPPPSASSSSGYSGFNSGYGQQPLSSIQNVVYGNTGGFAAGGGNSASSIPTSTPTGTSSGSLGLPGTNGVPGFFDQMKTLGTTLSQATAPTQIGTQTGQPSSVPGSNDLFAPPTPLTTPFNNSIFPAGTLHTGTSVTATPAQTTAAAFAPTVNTIDNGVAKGLGAGTPPATQAGGTYFNPYTNQWQSTPPVNNPANSGLATVNNPGNFVPQYLSGQNVTGPGLPAGGQAQNPQYYATQQSAQWLAQQLGLDPSAVFMNSNGYSPNGTAGPGSPFNFPGAYMIRLPDGRVINAGQELQPWSNGSANADTIRNILSGGASLASQQALMPLSPSVQPGNYQGGNGAPLTLTPQAQQAANAANPATPAATQPSAASTSAATNNGLDPNLLAFLNLFSNSGANNANAGSGSSLLQYLMSLTGGNQTSNNSLGGLSAIFDQLMGQSDLYQRRRQYPQFA